MRLHRLACAVLAILAGGLSTPSTRADDGDPAGWSVLTDPRGRAFLVATETAGGPRLLTVACLRDVDEVTVYAEVPGLVAGHEGVALRLAVADADWDLVATADAIDGRVVATAEAADGAAARRALESRLTRILTAPGPLVVSAEGAGVVEIPLEALPPRAGVARPLARFRTICFGR